MSAVHLVIIERKDEICGQCLRPLKPGEEATEYEGKVYCQGCTDGEPSGVGQEKR